MNSYYTTNIQVGQTVTITDEEGPMEFKVLEVRQGFSRYKSRGQAASLFLAGGWDGFWVAAHTVTV